MQDIVYTAVVPAVVAMKVCLPVCDSVVAWFSGLVLIYYLNMVEGESRDKPDKLVFRDWHCRTVSYIMQI